MDVELYEDNAGGLTLVYGERAWTGIEPDGGDFAADAQGIIDGFTDGWTGIGMTTTAAIQADLDHPETHHIATYRPRGSILVGAMTIIKDRAGYCGRMYLGLPVEREAPDGYPNY